MAEIEKHIQDEDEINKRATNEEVVTFLIGHIDKPCEVRVGEKIYNIRDFYIREAERLLDPNNEKRLTDSKQIERLEKKIREYKPL